ncbi:hypothetical protein FHR22_002636 [Sphingopyxis panaciterrae]|uniref:SOS response-associated peptidase family protein n=1 Tax=Sphingopyxis panaciterrae TaxID=363841 RepID=UPI00141EB5E7|nr:SOS response-associated peptidase family protein [Sphingopyxis panaciterrae]NIJ37933.1 hypothetical protein [Sphingopyxis panaciterrae]
MNDAIDLDPSLDGPGRRHMVMHAAIDEPISMYWGLPSNDPGIKKIALLQSERARIDRPCLIIATEFGMQREGGGAHYRARLITDEPFFCIAGVWRPRGGHRDWPDSFAALTVPAYPDLAPYKDRHVAVVHPDDWDDWMDQTRDPLDILRPFPKNSFIVKGPPVQSSLAL